MLLRELFYLQKHCTTNSQTATIRKAICTLMCHTHESFWGREGNLMWWVLKYNSVVMLEWLFNCLNNMILCHFDYLRRNFISAWAITVCYIFKTVYVVTIAIICIPFFILFCSFIVLIRVHVTNKKQWNAQ